MKWHRALLIGILGIAWPLVTQAADPATEAAVNTAIDFLPVYLALAGVGVLMACMLFYVWGLRERVATMVGGNGQDSAAAAANFAAYNALPMGLPRGTVRALLALIVVFGSIIFLAVSIVKSDTYKFPETLAGILGAILGFYFGKSATDDDGTAIKAVTAANADAKDSADKAATATQEAADAKQDATAAKAQADQATADKDAATGSVKQLATVHLDAVQDDLQQAADLGKSLATLLPGAAGRDIGTAAEALGGTIAAVNDLRSGDLAGAMDKAGSLVADAAPNLPLVQILKSAAAAIGPVIGGAFPPVALLTTIVGLGSKLSAAAYARWVARVMDEPYTPSQFSPDVIGSNEAIAIVQQVPAVAAAVAPALQAGDRAAVIKIVKDALSEDGVAALAEQFSSMDHPTLEHAVHDLQKAALDTVLKGDLPANAGADVPAMLQAIDKIRADKDASAALDTVMTTVTQLKRSGQHPETAFNAAADKLKMAA